MSRTDIQLPTPDGDARAFVFRPDHGEGPWPGAIVLMDAPAIRPALFDLSQRLADHGYLVLLPDLFWRAGDYGVINLAEVFGDEVKRREVFGRLMGSTDAEKQMRDVAACLEFLADQPDAQGEKVGVTGYCMGGSVALRAAAAFPDRIVAAGAFHASNVATDAPNSPHLGAPNIRARVLVGGADQDAGFPPEQADRLRAALEQAGVESEVAIYPGARHGFVMPDLPVYNADGAERHWRELFALFDGALKSAQARS